MGTVQNRTEQVVEMVRGTGIVIGSLRLSLGLDWEGREALHSLQVTLAVEPRPCD